MSEGRGWDRGCGEEGRFTKKYGRRQRSKITMEKIWKNIVERDVEESWAREEKEIKELEDRWQKCKLPLSFFNIEVS